MQFSFKYPQTLFDLHGDEGRAWYAHLPKLLDSIAQRWGLTVLEPFANLTYNYVTPAVQADGMPVVLKLGVPGGMLEPELVALRVFAGRGGVRILDADPQAAALLLERLLPGRPLSALEDDDTATVIAADVMAALWCPLPAVHSFETVENLAAGLERLRPAFGGTTGPFPTSLVQRAEGIFSELLANQGPRVLLHGDLHHGNILQAGPDDWRAIDPQGPAGEAEYDAGALLRNPNPTVSTWADLPRRQQRRLDILSERLGFDRQRLEGYGFARAVLTAWWNYEDHHRIGDGWLEVAESLV